MNAAREVDQWLVCGSHIATHDTYGHDRERDYFDRLEQGPEVRDPTVRES